MVDQWSPDDDGGGGGGDGVKSSDKSDFRGDWLQQQTVHAQRGTEVLRDFCRQRAIQHTQSPVVGSRLCLHVC